MISENISDMHKELMEVIGKYTSKVEKKLQAFEITNLALAFTLAAFMKVIGVKRSHEYLQDLFLVVLKIYEGDTPKSSMAYSNGKKIHEEIIP